MIRFNHVSTHPRIRPNVWRLPTNLGSKAIPRTGCCASGQMQWRSQHIRSHRGWTNQHWHSNRFSFVVSKASANRATDVALMTSCDKTKVHTSTDPMDPGHRKCSALLRQGFCETKQRFWASGPSLSAEAIGGVLWSCHFSPVNLKESTCISKNYEEKCQAGSSSMQLAFQLAEWNKLPAQVSARMTMQRPQWLIPRPNVAEESASTERTPCDSAPEKLL
jgi:hypothetical protein